MDSIFNVFDAMDGMMRKLNNNCNLFISGGQRGDLFFEEFRELPKIITMDDVLRITSFFKRGQELAKIYGVQIYGFNRCTKDDELTDDPNEISLEYKLSVGCRIETQKDIERLCKAYIEIHHEFEKIFN